MNLQLNDEQRQRVEDSRRLIGGFLRHHDLPVDTYYGACAEGLCKAALTYDPSRAAWSTWAYLKMWGEVCLEMRRKYRRPPTCSIDAVADTGDCMSIVGIEAQSTLDNLAKQLSARDRTVLKLIIVGKNQTEIAHAVGVSQPHVSRIKSRIKQLCKEMIE